MCIVFNIHLLSAGTNFGDPNGNKQNKVVLSSVKASDLLDAERKNDTAENLAWALLSLLSALLNLPAGIAQSQFGEIATNLIQATLGYKM